VLEHLVELLGKLRVGQVSVSIVKGGSWHH
jgi:hypothetical protein